MKFVFFNITVIAALTYLIMNDAPNTKTAIKNLAAQTETEVKQLATKLQQLPLSNKKQQLDPQVTKVQKQDEEPNKVSSLPPLDDVKVVDVRVVNTNSADVETTSTSISENNFDKDFDKDEVFNTISEETSELLTATERHRQLSRLADSMELLSINKLSRD